MGKLSEDGVNWFWFGVSVTKKYNIYIIYINPKEPEHFSTCDVTTFPMEASMIRFMKFEMCIKPLQT